MGRTGCRWHSAFRRALAAQDSTTYKNHLYDKFQAAVVFTTVLNNSEARVDGSNGEGTNLNFKDLLGISGTSVQPALGLDVEARAAHRT